MICTIPSCDNKVIYKTHSLCTKHEAIRRDLFCGCGRPSFRFSTKECAQCHQDRTRQGKGFCSKRHCWEKIYQKNLCSVHYYRGYKSSNAPCPDCLEEKAKKPSPQIKRGYCDKHYRRRKRKGEWTTVRCHICQAPAYTDSSKLCSVHYDLFRQNVGLTGETCRAWVYENHEARNCDQPVHSKSLCHRCYQKWYYEAKQEDGDYRREAEAFVVPESVRCNIQEMVAQYNHHGFIDYNLWTTTVYNGRPHWAAQRQWTRIRAQLKELAIPFIEEADYYGRVRLKFEVTIADLDGYFRGEYVATNQMAETFSNH